MRENTEPLFDLSGLLGGILNIVKDFGISGFPLEDAEIVYLRLPIQEGAAAETP